MRGGVDAWYGFVLFLVGLFAILWGYAQGGYEWDFTKFVAIYGVTHKGPINGTL